MKPRSLRARLTLWHSALVGLLVVTVAAGAYAFIRTMEIRRVDSMLIEQSEIVAKAARQTRMGASPLVRADTAGFIETMHDLRTRGVRTWLFDSLDRPVITTEAVHEDEGNAEERRVLGDSVDSAAVTTLAATPGGARRFVNLDGATSRARLLVAPMAAGDDGRTVVVSYSLRELDAMLASAGIAAVVTTALALLLSLIGGYILARRSLAPVAAMTAQAARIGGSNIHERIPGSDTSDELGQLAGTFNAMLDRVVAAIEEQRRFMADASHEVRTPVAVLRGEAEVTLAAPTRSEGEYREALTIVAAASNRLSRTVNDVFLLARGDAGSVSLVSQPLYLDEIVQETCRDMRTLAGMKHIEIRLDTVDDVACVGDEELLRRLVANLVDNAIKYSPDGATIHVSLAGEPDGYRLSVRNPGTPIPAEARERVFDRFFRLSAARTYVGSSAGSGSGLGLSIARWIAELHGGRLELTESSVAGITFTLLLPLQRPGG